MRIDHNRHHFTQTYPTCGERRRLPLGHQSLVPRGLKLQTKVVNVTKKRYDLHNENLLGRGVLVALTTVLKRSLVSYSSRSAQLVDFIKQLRQTQVLSASAFLLIPRIYSGLPPAPANSIGRSTASVLLTLERVLKSSPDKPIVGIDPIQQESR